MTLELGDGVLVHYGAGDFVLERDGRLVARLALPSRRGCSGPWLRSLFVHEKTHTLLIEFEYHSHVDCVPPPPAWQLLRY
jgi:hypothetical protein